MAGFGRFWPNAAVCCHAGIPLLKRQTSHRDERLSELSDQGELAAVPRTCPPRLVVNHKWVSRVCVPRARRSSLTPGGMGFWDDLILKPVRKLD